MKIKNKTVPLQKKQVIFWLIVFVCCAPVVLSTISYYFLKPKNTVNYGYLLNPPVSVNELSLTEIKRPTIESALMDQSPESLKLNSISSLADLSGRWLLIRIGNGSCDSSCEKELYTMRQVRLMTGKNRHRVERVWLFFDENKKFDKSFDELLYEGTWKFKVTNEEGDLTKLFSSSLNKKNNMDLNGIWLVDPLGNFMMKYPKNPDIKKIYKDISRLLKVSRIG